MFLWWLGPQRQHAHEKDVLQRFEFMLRLWKLNIFVSWHLFCLCFFLFFSFSLPLSLYRFLSHMHTHTYTHAQVRNQAFWPKVNMWMMDASLACGKNVWLSHKLSKCLLNMYVYINHDYAMKDREKNGKIWPIKIFCCLHSFGPERPLDKTLGFLQYYLFLQDRDPVFVLFKI